MRCRNCFDAVYVFVVVADAVVVVAFVVDADVKVVVSYKSESTCINVSLEFHILNRSLPGAMIAPA